MFYTLQRKEKLMIKLNKCGDDKSIPKEIHDKIKSCTNSIMDFDQDVKWYDVYSMFEEIFKDGKKTKNSKGEEITYEQIRSFTDQFDNNCSDGWITEIVNGEVDIDKLKSFILTHYEEHKDEDGNKVEDEDIEGYFTKDNCDEIFVKTEKEKGE